MARLSIEARIARGVIADRFGIDGPPVQAVLAVLVPARDRLYERSVMLELPRPAIADDPALLGRFVEGARAAVAVEHAGVVRVLGVEYDADGSPFVVRERVRGALLSERPTPMALDAAWQILDPVIEALATAHALGLVHGALRPAQIVLHENARGALRPKIDGFGSAPLFAAVFGDSGPVAPRYAAPELFGGAPPTPASDVWAIAVIACELLSGEHPTPLPVSATPADLARVLTSTAPRSVARLVPQAPPAVAHALDRALAQRPDARWPNAVALQAALVDRTRALAAVPGGAAALAGVRDAERAAPARSQASESDRAERRDADAREPSGGARRQEREPSGLSRHDDDDEPARRSRDDDSREPRGGLRDEERRGSIRSARDGSDRREPDPKPTRHARDDDDDHDERKPAGRVRDDDDDDRRAGKRARTRDDDDREPTGRRRGRGDDDGPREPSGRSRSRRLDDDDDRAPPRRSSLLPALVAGISIVALVAAWLATRPTEPPPGAVIVGNLPEAAALIVDGAARATDEHGRLELRPGRHHLEVTGFTPIDVEIAAGEAMRLELVAVAPLPTPPPAPIAPAPGERSRCFGAWRGGFDCESGWCDVRTTLIVTPSAPSGACGTLEWARDGAGSGRAELSECAFSDHGATFEEPSGGALRRVSMRCTEDRTTLSAYDSEEGETRSGAVRREGEAPPEAELVTPPGDEHPCHGSWSGFSSVTGASVRLDLDALGEARCGRIVDEGTFALSGCELDGAMLEARSELGNFTVECATDESGATMRSSAWGLVTLSPR